MRQLLLPMARAKLLDKKTLEELMKKLQCKIEIQEENEAIIEGNEGNAYAEYIAYNVLSAFGRGFPIEKAYRLLSDGIFFKSIDLKDMFKNKKQIMRVKARVIGRGGKAKNYIQAVSGADIAVYGNTISGIGTVEQLRIAYSAIDILLSGGTHKKAYRVMEKERSESEGV